MAFQKVGLTFYCDIGRSRQSSSYPLTTFLVRHERRGACKKRFDFYKFAFFFFPFFQKCLFVCLRSRAGKIKRRGKKQTNKTKKRRRRRQQLARGPARGFICLHILDTPDNEKKNGHKRLPYLVLYNNFLGNAGGKCVAKKEDNCFDIKVVTDS